MADLDGCIADVEAAMRVAVPNVSEELAFSPARCASSGKRRGNGLLGEIARLTDEGLIPERCEVLLLVLPAIGGYGGNTSGIQHAPYRTVLAYPIAEFPKPCDWVGADLATAARCAEI